MVIKSLEQRKKQRTLLILAVVIVIAAVVVLYFGFWKSTPVTETTTELPGEAQVPTQARPQTSSIISDEKLKKIDLDTDFFINTILETLKSHGILPVQKGTTGRTNPFAP